jgi:hypothetical protein
MDMFAPLAAAGSAFLSDFGGGAIGELHKQNIFQVVF